MKKITVVIPKKKGKKIDKIVKKLGVSKVFRTSNRKNYKYELIITELQANELMNSITEELNIRIGKPVEGGYLTVKTIEVVEPYVYDKGTSVELEQLILTNAKRFIKLDNNYITFILCAAIIACIGFILDSVAVIIGAMIIGPLMNPLMSVSYGIAKSNNKLVKKGLNNEIIGITIIILVSLLMSLLPNPSLTFEQSMINYNLIIYFLLSFIIGIVAANSFLTGDFEEQIGVAVCISLIPPLTNSAILLMNNSINSAFNSVLIFITSLIGMHLGAVISFLIKSYKELKKSK